LAASAIAGLKAQLDAALDVVQQLAGDVSRPEAQRHAHLATLRRQFREMALTSTYQGTAAGWALSDGRVPELLAESIIHRAQALIQSEDDGDDAKAWQHRFLSDLGLEFLNTRFC
jgi:hypothetical protein